MLTPQSCHYLKTKLAEFFSQLDDYNPPNQLAYIEAKYSFFLLRRILHHSPLSKIHVHLSSFLLERWELIYHSDLTYCHSFVSPINQMCIEVARTLQKCGLRYGYTTHYLQHLMPSLLPDNKVRYINTIFENDPIDLREYILSDDKQKLISITDVLEFAQRDAIFKRPYLMQERTSSPISSQEYDRLIARHPSVMQAIRAIHDRKTFSYFGNTAGAAINRLINGLREGGRRQGYDEYDAGRTAMVAIHEFNEFLQRLSSSVREAIFSSGYIDDFEDNDNGLVSVQQIWERLTTPPATKQSTSYCVEIIANSFDEILKQNDHLFMISDSPTPQSNDLDRLNRDVQDNLSAMSEALKTIEYHMSQDEEDNKELYFNLIRNILYSSFRNLTLDDLLIIATQSSRFSNIYRPHHNDFSREFYKMISQQFPLLWAQLQEVATPSLKHFIDNVERMLNQSPTTSPFMMFKRISPREHEREENSARP